MEERQPEQELVFRVDMQGRNLPARYVRAARVPEPRETKPIERFNLRGFMVYGSKSYQAEHACGT